MTNDFSKVINILIKEKPDMYFTRVCQPLPEWCPDHVNTFRSPDGVPYGYYEIKESSMGPVMLHVSRRSPYSYLIDVEIKVADRGWALYKSDFGPGSCGHGVCSDAYDLIEKSKRHPSNMSAENAIEKWEHFCDHPKPQKEDEKKPIKGINALKSFDAIMTVVNRHRPYEPSDFVPESFIPDLVIALLMTLNFAGASAKINTTAPRAKQVVTATRQQSQANYINYLTALQKVKGC